MARKRAYLLVEFHAGSKEEGKRLWNIIGSSIPTSPDGIFRIRMTRHLDSLRPTRRRKRARSR